MGGVDGVVNAAGIVIHGSVLDVGVAAWQHVLDVNLTGTYIVVRCCLPWLTKAPFATIINIASGQGLLPNTPKHDGLCRLERRRRESDASSGGRIGPLNSRQQRVPRHG